MILYSPLQVKNSDFVANISGTKYEFGMLECWNVGILENYRAKPNK
jgi:hypothetical protein